MFATNLARLALRFAAALGTLSPLAAALPAHAAMTEVYYQRVFDLGCDGSRCNVKLPKVAAGKQLNVRWLSCYSEGQTPAINGDLSFEDLPGGKPDVEYLTPIEVDATTYFVVQETDVLILAQKDATIELYGGGAAASCTVIGRLQTLS